MVSAELATALGALVLVLVVGLNALAAGVDLIRVTDAARQGARAAARGETPEVVRQQADRTAPGGASVTVGADGEQVRVAVSAPYPPMLRPLVSGRLSATAVARPERVDETAGPS